MIGTLFATALAVPLQLSSGYFGHLGTHPGAFVAAERPLLARGPHALTLGGRVAGYTHPGNHVGVMLRPELGYRLTASAGPFVELGVGPAYLHRFLSGVVYREGGRRGLDAGRPSFAPGGHWPMWDQPDLFASEVLGFLASLEE